MKMKSVWMAIIAVFAAMTIGMADAEARRMGGGGSMGKQAPVQRQATPPQQAPQNAAAARPGQAAPAAAGNRWMGPIAGIAAGLGLAALAGWLGFGEGLATIMLLMLVAVAVLVVVRMVMARRAGGQPQPAFAGGRGDFRGERQQPSVSRFEPTPAAAPARSFEQPGAGGHAAPQSAGLTVPAGFDTAGFVHSAKVYFVRMQAAFDAGNTADLREFTTPEMFAELKIQLDQRNGEPGQTDVVTLDAEVLGVQQDANEYMASVRFTGLLRELALPEAAPFEEVWNFTKPVEGRGGWVLAGIQQLSGH
jgi:predicted lipid-binding transport protein (Tim44 family)